MNGYGENHADVVPLKLTDIEGSKTPIIISINVSGTTFQVKASTLLRFPNSRLADLVLKHSACTGQSFYFDQDPAIFGHILRCCRSGEVHIPQTICPREFLKEIEFWKLPLDKVSPCCWPTFYRADDILETLEKLKEVTSEICDRPTNNNVRSFRNKVWLFLENPNYSKGAKVIPFYPKYSDKSYTTAHLFVLVEFALKTH